MHKLRGSLCRSTTSTTGANTWNISLEFDGDPIKGPSRDNITTFATIPEGLDWEIYGEGRNPNQRRDELNRLDELRDVLVYPCTN